LLPLPTFSEVAQKSKGTAGLRQHLCFGCSQEFKIKLGQEPFVRMAQIRANRYICQKRPFSLEQSSHGVL